MRMITPWGGSVVVICRTERIQICRKKKKKKTIREGAKNALRHTHTNEKVQSYMDLQFSSLGEKTRENRCLIGAEKKGCDMRH